MRTAILAVVLLTLVQVRVSGGPVVYYSFNATNAIADVGSFTSVFSYQNSGGFPTNFTGGTAQNKQPGFSAGQAIQQDHWMGNTNFFQFTFDAAAWQNILVSYVLERSSYGPTNTIFQYSTTGAGGVFVDVATNPVPVGTFTGGVFTQDLSTVAALNGDSALTFRITGINVGRYDGTLTLDNFTVDAVAIPEPATTMLAGLGLVAVFAWRTRRR